MRDEMLRAKVLIFMIPLVLPIGQPRVEATDREAGVSSSTSEAPPVTFPAQVLTDGNDGDS